MSEQLPINNEKLPSFEAFKEPEHHVHHEHHDRPEESEKLKPEEAREEIENALAQSEKNIDQQEKMAPEKAEQARPVTPGQKSAAYEHTLFEIRSQMSTPQRTFSKFIHRPVVEIASEAAGKTIARPTSILYGSLCAFLVMLGVYLLAKHNGFRLSGSEFIVLFAVGWALGLIIDLVRSLFQARHS